MECKAGQSTKDAVGFVGIDLTRMECKESLIYDYKIRAAGIDLTRMECKGEYASPSRRSIRV